MSMRHSMSTLSTEMQLNVKDENPSCLAVSHHAVMQIFTTSIAGTTSVLNVQPDQSIDDLHNQIEGILMPVAFLGVVIS